MRKVFISAASFAALALLGSAPASAIECEGNFQVQRDGNMIATPFCQDNYLAIVAQQNGMNVSAGAIRSNPSIKERACRFVGDDNRVRDTCAPYRLDGNRRWR
jgi:hypothetical protein